MSKAKGDAIFLHWHPTGVVLARGASFGEPYHLTDFKSYPLSSANENPLSVLGELKTGKKGFVEAHVGISHPGFFHLFHEVDSLVKAKAPDYFPQVIKGFLGEKKDDDVFYHVLNASDGNAYSPDNVTEKRFVISGIPTRELLKIQETLTESGIYPRRIECNALTLFGFFRNHFRQTGEQPPMIFLEVFWEESLLVVISSSGKPVFKRIHSGEKSMCEQIRDELSLKDIASSRKLLYSSTIDLSDIGRKVINPLFREIAAVIGLYEVETGQSVGSMFVSNLPLNHLWIADLLAGDLGMDRFEWNPEAVLERSGIHVEDGVKWDVNDPRMLSLFAMLETD